MPDRAFVIMQVGAKDSTERKRADEIYDYIVAPAVNEVGLEPYRADLDPSPGAITPKMISELLSARLVIADLTGHNPNVFYELGITHSFARPLISIADSSSTLPFDAKDERVIELGVYSEGGLTYAQGEQAKASLQESLNVVLSDGYLPPSPLRDAAANRSVDDLAPENPIAAELAQMRETLEDIRKRVTGRNVTSRVIRDDVLALRNVIRRNLGFMDDTDFEMMTEEGTSSEQRAWVDSLHKEWVDNLQKERESRRSRRPVEDPWAADTAGSGTADTSDEPPF